MKLPSLSIRPLRQHLAAISLLLLGLLLAWGLGVTSLQWHLQQRAEAELHVLGEGLSPFDWRFASSRDLVRAASLEGDQPRLSEQGLSFGIGGEYAQFSLRLDGRVIDSLRYERVFLSLSSDSVARLDITAQTTDARRLHYGPLALDRGHNELVVPLASLRDTDASGGMALSQLIIQIHAEPGTTVELQRISVLPHESLTGLPWPPATSKLPTTDQELTAAASLYASQRQIYPVFVADVLASRPEQLLWHIDQVRQQIPAAIILPLPVRTAAVPSWPTLQPFVTLMLLVIWICILVVLRLRPQPVHRWPDLLAALAPPLLIVLSLSFDSPLPASVGLLLLLSVAYALSLTPSWRTPVSRRDRDQHSWQRVWLLPVGASLLVVASLYLLALGAGWELRSPPEPEKLLRYAVWVGLQQALLGPVISNGLRHGLRGPDTLVAACAALLFALLHSPNSMLMVLTLMAGMLWSLHWLHHQRWLPLVCSHLIAALGCFMMLPPWLLRSAEVSGRYFM